MRFSSRAIVKSIISLTVSLAMMPSLNVLAAHKTVDVPLDKEYKNCEFSIQFDNEDAPSYIVKIKSPSGEVSDISVGEDGSASFFTKTAAAGTWTISADDDNWETDDESIGEMKVSVRAGVDGGTETSSQKINVAKEISGLNHYFKDDSIVIEWNDDTVGNVNVEVVNAKTLEKYYSDVVRNKKSVEVPLPAQAQEITVSVVPSVSEKIDGAGEQFTIKVVNNPDATLTFENGEYTNVPSLEYTAVLGQAYSLEYYVNGKRVGGEDKCGAGEYTFSIPLFEGDNDVKAYVVDDDGNMRSTSASVILDTEPPTLQIEKDLDGVTTKEKSVTFSGKAGGYTSLKFNGSEIDTDYDGAFKVDSELTEGANRFQIIAEDVAGNTVEYTAEVTMVVDKAREIPWLYIILGVIILALVIYIGYNKFLTTHEVVYEESVEIEETMQKPKRNRFRGKSKGLIFDILSIAIPVLIIVLFVNLAISVARCESASMEKTIMTGDVVVQNKLAYIFREPQRGDIITFKNEQTNNEMFVKRIVGLPGDHVSFKDGFVYLNGAKCIEEYIGEDVETNSEKEFDVPDGCYFVLGDNRENSDDARYWANPYVSRKDITSRVVGNVDISFITNKIAELAKK